MTTSAGRWRRAVGFLACATTAACAAEADSREPTRADGIGRADSIVAAWVDDGPIPGAVLSVVRDGETVFERAYGLAHHEPPVAMETTTIFDLASVTKVMATTWAGMLLVDAGQLDLDAPITEVLIDFTDPAKATMTTRHLLTHRSGFAQWKPTYYHASTPDEAYAYVRDLPLEWPVGEGHHYSDLGFMLLGRVVEVQAGQPLDEFLEERLYGPLGLTATGYRPAGSPPLEPPAVAATSRGNPFERRMVHDANFGYTIEGDAEAWSGWRDSWLKGEVNDGNAHHAWRGVAGHAGLFSTAADLQMLLGMLLNQGGSWVSADVVETFLANSGDGQALGWQIPEYAPEGSFTHTGFTGTWVLGVPAHALSVVLLTNRQNGGVDDDTRYPDLAPLQQAVARALLGDEQAAH